MSTNDENNELTLDEEEGIIELEDEDGNVSRFESATLYNNFYKTEFRGGIYYALVPADYDEEEGATEFIILKETEINGENMLATVDNEEEMNAAGDEFLKRFAELPELDIDEE